jgi:hypothetical protein
MRNKCVATVTMSLIAFVLLATISCQAKEKISPHFSNAINYSNEAAKVINALPALAVVEPNDMESVIGWMRKALSEATLVNIDDLNEIYPSLGDHFKDEFTEGLRLIIEGHENLDSIKSLRGQQLSNQWGNWYTKNVKAIREHF